MIESRVARFFSYARMRHEIYLRRQAGEPRPWTTDPVLSRYRITNVFRELDATTVALRAITDQVRDQAEVLPMITLLRWLNRRESWSCLLDAESYGVADFAEDVVDPTCLPQMEAALREWRPNGPWVTGAYIIKTPDGMDKLAGVFEIYRRFLTAAPALVNDKVSTSLDWRAMAQFCLEQPGQIRLQTVWEWLRRHDHQGDFTAYEVVSDLRHTALLDRAPDIMTWANAGPGAMRGLNRLSDRPLHAAGRSADWQAEMRELLRISQDGVHWPAGWQQWELREVEHHACEFDKISRALNGEGFPRGRYP